MQEEQSDSVGGGRIQSGGNHKAVRMVKETKGGPSERPHGATSAAAGKPLGPEPQPGVSDPTAVSVASQEPQRLVLGTSGDHLVNGSQQSYARPVMQQQQRSAAVSDVTPQVPADNVASAVLDNVASAVLDNVASAVLDNVASAVLDNVASAVRDNVASAVRDNVASAVLDNVASAVLDNVASAVLDNVASAVRDNVASAVRDNVASAVRDNVASAVLDNVASAVLDNVASAVRDNVASAVLDNVASAVLDNVASAVLDNVASAVLDNVASAVRDNVASAVRDNVASAVRDNPAVTGRVVASGQWQEIVSGGGSSGNAWSHGSPFSSDTGYTVQALKRRNVVRFRHRGAKDELPDRRFVIRELLCNQMGFRPTNILAVISLPDRQGYDVSFKVRSELRHFWANFFKFRDVDGWNKFRFIPISKTDTVSVTINFWNEAVPPQYIVIWLQRHCDLMSDLTKDRDADGIWTGGWRVLVKLRQSQNVTHHLPVSFYIGREKGVCFYAGQPRECYKCGRTGHLASVCAYSVVKCSLCGEVGHAKAMCRNVQCDLCGRIGGPRRDYPDAWDDQDLLVAAEDLEEEEEVLLSGPVLRRPDPQSESSDSVQGASDSSEGSSSPASVSTRENNERAKIKRRKKS
ncbi:uncharacterized protein [Dendrobates tinctorius]|uniref:uncharacterized protein n=1 Tax=Dendrobates tinctorius TaxID=92724 RepID=UPI003CCA1364